MINKFTDLAKAQEFASIRPFVRAVVEGNDGKFWVLNKDLAKQMVAIGRAVYVK